MKPIHTVSIHKNICISTITSFKVCDKDKLLAVAVRNGMMEMLLTAGDASLLVINTDAIAFLSQHPIGQSERLEFLKTRNKDE